MYIDQEFIYNVCTTIDNKVTQIEADYRFIS